jgi:hypothetical protein
MSDDFSDAVKRILAARAGHLCSNSECRAATSGPQDDPAKAVNLGVAAHITAASPGGRRYDPDLSVDGRSPPANGVWLCQNCAKLIDNDVARFSMEVLKGWKAYAEREARTRVGKTTACSISDLFMDVSVAQEDTSSWNRGEGTIVLREFGCEEYGQILSARLPYQQKPYGHSKTPELQVRFSLRHRQSQLSETGADLPLVTTGRG